MSSTNENIQTCPICLITEPRRVRCSNTSCTFVVTTCPRCDREQAVAAFVADHEKDCGNVTTGSPARFPEFRLPRHVAA